jgi:hypothetical protein
MLKKAFSGMSGEEGIEGEDEGDTDKEGSSKTHYSYDSLYDLRILIPAVETSVDDGVIVHDGSQKLRGHTSSTSTSGNAYDPWERAKVHNKRDGKRYILASWGSGLGKECTRSEEKEGKGGDKGADKETSKYPGRLRSKVTEASMDRTCMGELYDYCTFETTPGSIRYVFDKTPNSPKHGFDVDEEIVKFARRLHLLVADAGTFMLYIYCYMLP